MSEKEQKHPGGRPRKFSTPEELQKVVDDYFKNPPRKKRYYSKDGELYEEVGVYSVCGLALALGFEDRQSIYDYISRDDKFSGIVKRAKLFIENEYELALRDHNVTGVIFALKNMGWKDKQEIDQNISVKEMPTIKINDKEAAFDIGEEGKDKNETS